MADLHAIYQELGISGLIPHATRETSKAYSMLVAKIKAGETMYYLQSPVTNAPFLQVMDRARRALFFTSEAGARYEADKLRCSQCMDTTVIEFPGNKSVEDAMMSLYDLGVDTIWLDQTVTLKLAQFIDLPKYDGYPNEEFLLRNHKLNGALHYYMQIVQAQMSNLDAEYYFARALCNGHVLLPVNPEKLEEENVLDTLVFLDDESDIPMVAAFTDWEQLSLSELQSSAIVVSFADLANLIKNGTLTVALNPAGVAMHLRSHYVDYLLNVAQAPTAAHIPLVSSLARSQEQNTEEDWTMTDFVPDFLR